MIKNNMIKNNMNRIITTGIVLMLAIAFLMPSQVLAVSYDTKASAKNKINKSIKNHKGSVTFYTKKKLDPYALFVNSALSLSTKGNIIAESRAYRGDYNRYSYLKGFGFRQWKYQKGKKKYYKYKYTFSYNISKKKTQYIDKRCKTAAKSFRKGSVKKRTQGICKWIAKNMSYKVVNYTTLYEPLKNKKGKCTHYSFLFYKIAKEAGLDVRLVIGQARSNPFGKYYGHMWCIVKSGNKWYQVDPTWADNGKTISTRWIMKGKSNVFFSTTHKPSKKFAALMKKKCPLAK